MRFARLRIDLQVDTASEIVRALGLFRDLSVELIARNASHKRLIYSRVRHCCMRALCKP